MKLAIGNVAIGSVALQDPQKLFQRKPELVVKPTVYLSGAPPHPIGQFGNRNRALFVVQYLNEP